MAVLPDSRTTSKCHSMNGASCISKCPGFSLGSHQSYLSTHRKLWRLLPLRPPYLVFGPYICFCVRVKKALHYLSLTYTNVSKPSGFRLPKSQNFPRPKHGNLVMLSYHVFKLLKCVQRSVSYIGAL